MAEATPTHLPGNRASLARLADALRENERLAAMIQRERVYYASIIQQGKVDARSLADVTDNLANTLTELDTLQVTSAAWKKDAAKWRALSMLYPGGSDALFAQLQEVAKAAKAVLAKEPVTQSQGVST